MRLRLPVLDAKDIYLNHCWDSVEENVKWLSHKARIFLQGQKEEIKGFCQSHINTSNIYSCNLILCSFGSAKGTYRTQEASPGGGCTRGPGQEAVHQ